MVNLSPGRGSLQSSMSMVEIVGKIPSAISRLGTLVERHEQIKNPVERRNAEMQIMETYFILQDYLGKFATDFLNGVGKALSNEEMYTLSAVYASARAKNPIKALILALENVKKKGEDISRKFKNEAGDEVRKNVVLRRLSDNIGNRVKKDADMRLASIQKKVQQHTRSIEQLMASKTSAPTKEQEQAIKQRLEMYKAMQGSQNQKTAARR